jgi:hypothetical protein
MSPNGVVSTAAWLVPTPRKYSAIPLPGLQEKVTGEAVMKKRAFCPLLGRNVYSYLRQR